MLRNISIYKQSLINVLDDAIISIYKSFTNQSTMTTWAVQPSDYGNEVKIWADVFDGSFFPQAKAHAERTAEQLGRPVTIWKVGSVSEFKWMETVLVKMGEYFMDMGWIDDDSEEAFDSLIEKICEPAPWDYRIDPQTVK